MRLTLLLLSSAALAFAVSAPKAATGHPHHDAEAYMPSQCPFVSTTTGFRCLGIPIPNGFSVAGDKYRCSNGHTWVVSSR